MASITADSSLFRTCPDTGLKVHVAAERLIMANAVVAVVYLLIGGLLGLGVALTRWPAVHLLDAETFYAVLTAHGIDVLLFWIIFFEMAILYFASAILLNSRLATPWLAWVGFVMMLVWFDHRELCRPAGRIERHVHLIRADAGGAGVLSRDHPVRGRSADRVHCLLCDIGRREGGKDL